MNPRDLIAQGEPTGVDASFPSVRPHRGTWYRAHAHRPGQADGGCWFWASLPAGIGPGGRFDLPAPRGTCYLADSALAAARERLGRPGRVVAHDEVAGVVISTVPHTPGTLADLLHRDASAHGITSELGATVRYALSQRWAAAFATAGFSGVRYQPRFSTNRSVAIADFGPAGAPTPPPAVHATRPMADVLRDAGYTLPPPPTLANLGELL